MESSGSGLPLLRPQRLGIKPSQNEMMKMNIYGKVAALSICGLLVSEAQENKPKVIQSVYEVFALSKSDAATMQRADLADRGIYARMIAGLESGKVRQKKLQVLRSLGGNNASTKSVIEHIAPTEFEPPELPNSVGVSTPSGEEPSDVVQLNQVINGLGWQAGKFPATPATPSAFDTYLLGDQMEVEAMEGQGENPNINLRYSVAHKNFIQKDFWGQGLSKVEMPRLGAQRLQSSLVVKSGVPTFVGTISPGAEEQPKEGEAQVWMAFFTVTLIELEE